MGITDEALRRDTMANWDGITGPDMPAVPGIQFGDAPGNVMSVKWAAYMLAQWHRAGSSKLSFADAVKATAVHFMVDGES